MHGIRGLGELAIRVASLERRVNGGMLSGVVHQVDASLGLVRLNLGDATGDLYLSPWVPYAQIGGQIRLHNPPSVGQQMMLMAPGGEIRQALALPLGFSDENPSPSDEDDAAVLTFGSLSIRLTGDGAVVTVGGVSLEITGSGVAITGGSVTHNGQNIGDTHVHGGVEPGPSDTTGPK